MDFKDTLNKTGLQSNEAQGEVVLVTGAGRGIGQAVARAFGMLGARVVIAELSPQGQETERLIQEAGGKALFVQTDVSDPQSVAELKRQVLQAYGPVTVLVNNAILSPVASVLDMDVELWDRVMGVNLRGAFLTSKAFLPDMLASQGGVIINMVSAEAMPHLSAYITSKQGLAAFSQSLAGEVGPSGIKVIAFAPGFVDTPGLRQAAEGLAPHMGLNVEQFLNMPFHEAYQGPMPVEDAAAATAYLVLRLADVYQGENTTGYAVLERADYLAPSQSSPQQLQNEYMGQPIPSRNQASPDFQSGVRLSQQLMDTLNLTEQQFNSFPIFIRPMARSGFKGKTGLSLQDWQQKAAQLTTQFQKAAGGDAVARSELAHNYQEWIDRLNRLVVYYQGEPKEMGRFVKEAEAIQAAQRLANERTSLIQQLMANLQAVS